MKFILFSSLFHHGVCAFQPLLSHHKGFSPLGMTKTKVVVIGNGMVGQRFMENILDLDQDHQSISLVTFCEENRAAYNRVKLTSFFESRNPSDISMTGEYDAHGKTKWYENNNVEIFLNDKVVKIDTKSKTMEGESGRIVDYDIAVLATGSIRK